MRSAAGDLHRSLQEQFVSQRATLLQGKSDGENLHPAAAGPAALPSTAIFHENENRSRSFNKGINFEVTLVASALARASHTPRVPRGPADGHMGPSQPGGKDGGIWNASAARPPWDA